MRLHFTHPYKDNLDINFGQFTQIIGQNQQLKYYMWQIFMWYFDGKNTLKKIYRFLIKKNLKSYVRVRV